MRYARVLYSKMNKPWLIDVGRRLTEDHGIEPCYWIGLHNYENAVKSALPGVPFHRQEDAIRGAFPPTLDEGQMPPVDQAIMHGIAPFAHVYFQMIRRFGYGRPISVDEALDYQRRHVRIWHAVILKYRPTHLVCWSTPHNSFDYLLFQLCRYHGVRTVVIRKTSLPRVWVPSRDLGVDLSELSGEPDNARPSSELASYLARVRGSYEDAMPGYMRGVFYTERSSLAKRFGRPGEGPIDGARRIMRRLMAVNTAYYFTHDYESRLLTTLRFNVHRIQSKVRLRRLRRYYEELCRRQPPEPGKPYVLFALHLEPESTTCPDGDVYGDQSLAVELLSRMLPPDWLLCVRENPKQMLGIEKPAGGTYRSVAFYERLKRLPNVRFVRFDDPPFHAVDGAHAVATITGTIGWEAVVRGRPTLVFGHAWYKDCPGVFRITTAQSCAQAMDEIQRGFLVIPERVEDFVAGLEAKYGPLRHGTGESAELEDQVSQLSRLLRQMLGEPAVGVGAA